MSDDDAGRKLGYCTVSLDYLLLPKEFRQEEASKPETIYDATFPVPSAYTNEDLRVLREGPFISPDYDAVEFLWYLEQRHRIEHDIFRLGVFTILVDLAHWDGNDIARAIFVLWRFGFLEKHSEPMNFRLMHPRLSVQYRNREPNDQQEVH